MPTTLADRLFTTAAGQHISLFALFTNILNGDSVELARLLPHQRAPVVTALAILLSTLRRYTTGPLVTAGDWARAWRLQIGDEALRLVAPESEVAFFPPPPGPGDQTVAIGAERH